MSATYKYFKHLALPFRKFLTVITNPDDYFENRFTRYKEISSCADALNRDPANQGRAIQSERAMMSVALRSTTLAALLCSTPLMAYDGIIYFNGAVVEPTCQVGLSDVTDRSAHVQLSECGQVVTMMLNEPRGAQPSVSYRLTDMHGKALGRGITATGDADSVIREVTRGGVAAGQRNVVLVAEYL